MTPRLTLAIVGALASALVLSTTATAGPLGGAAGEHLAPALPPPPLLGAAPLGPDLARTTSDPPAGGASTTQSQRDDSGSADGDSPPTTGADRGTLVRPVPPIILYLLLGGLAVLIVLAGFALGFSYLGARRAKQVLSRLAQVDLHGGSPQSRSDAEAAASLVSRLEALVSDTQPRGRAFDYDRQPQPAQNRSLPVPPPPQVQPRPAARLSSGDHERRILEAYGAVLANKDLRDHFAQEFSAQGARATGSISSEFMAGEDVSQAVTWLVPLDDGATWLVLPGADYVKYSTAQKYRTMQQPTALWGGAYEIQEARGPARIVEAARARQTGGRYAVEARGLMVISAMG
jgi:hypothetical protein